MRYTPNETIGIYFNTVTIHLLSHRDNRHIVDRVTFLILFHRDNRHISDRVTVLGNERLTNN